MIVTARRRVVLDASAIPRCPLREHDDRLPVLGFHGEIRLNRAELGNNLVVRAQEPGAAGGGDDVGPPRPAPTEGGDFSTPAGCCRSDVRVTGWSSAVPCGTQAFRQGPQGIAISNSEMP